MNNENLFRLRAASRGGESARALCVCVCEIEDGERFGKFIAVDKFPSTRRWEEAQQRGERKISALKILTERECRARTHM